MDCFCINITGDGQVSSQFTRLSHNHESLVHLVNSQTNFVVPPLHPNCIPKYI